MVTDYDLKVNTIVSFTLCIELKKEITCFDSTHQTKVLYLNILSFVFLSFIFILCPLLIIWSILNLYECRLIVFFSVSQGIQLLDYLITIHRKWSRFSHLRPCTGATVRLLKIQEEFYLLPALPELLSSELDRLFILISMIPCFFLIPHGSAKWLLWVVQYLLTDLICSCCFLFLLHKFSNTGISSQERKHSSLCMVRYLQSPKLHSHSPPFQVQ